jgi:hypothetical protein
MTTTTPPLAATSTAPLRLTPAQYGFLLRGLHPNRVSRTPSGQSHLEQWDVRRTLTQVFGFGGWTLTTLRLWQIAQLEIPPGTITQTKWKNNVKTQVPNEKTLWTVVYGAEVRLTIKNADGTIGAVFEDGATGDSTNQPSLGDAHDQALKTSLSQALKRCAVNLGDQFGLGLYNGGNLDPVVISTALPPAADTADAPAAAIAHEPAPVQGETPATVDEYSEPIGRGEPPADPQPARAEQPAAPPAGMLGGRVPAEPPATVQREPGESAAAAAVRAVREREAARYGTAAAPPPAANGNGNGGPRPRQPRDDGETLSLVDAVLTCHEDEKLHSLFRAGEQLTPAGHHTDVRRFVDAAAAVLLGLPAEGPLLLGKLIVATKKHLDEQTMSVRDHVNAEAAFAAEHPTPAA